MEEDFVTKDGRKVRISIEDDYTAKVTTIPEGKQIGRIEFSTMDIDERRPYLHMRWCYLNLLGNSWKHQGIGRRCLELVRQISHMPLTANDDDGFRRDDGSHLTGDAPGFVARMREVGLIEGGRANDDDD